MKTLLFSTVLLLLSVTNRCLATAPAIGTTDFNSLATANLVTGASSPATVTNVGSLGWDFTANVDGGVLVMSIASSGVSGGASDKCIRTARSTSGFFVTSVGVKSNDGSAFMLTQVYMRIGIFNSTTADMIITGYRNGTAVTGATLTITGVASNTWLAFNVGSIAAFGKIDEFRFTQAGTSSAQIANLAVDDITIAAALPLTLINFSDLQENDAVLLNWTTASEENTLLFEIQRSDNTASFITVGKIPAAGNSDVPLNYHFTDILPTTSASKYYYRLRMEDLDGRYTYSPIIGAQTSGGSFGLSAYPNPIGGKTTLSATATTAGNALLSVTDMSGRQILIRPVYLQQGNNIFPLPLSQTLTKGVYLVRLIQQGRTETIRLLKTD